jgi:hypothetical protein
VTPFLSSILQNPATGQNDSKMTVFCKLPEERGDDIVYFTPMTPKLDFGIRIPALKLVAVGVQGGRFCNLPLNVA